MASIGTVTYPTADTWGVDAADLLPGLNLLWVSDGTDTFQVVVDVSPAAVPISASPVPFALSMPSASVSLVNAITERLKFPGPLKIWNGTALVDAPWKVFDGSSLS